MNIKCENCNAVFEIELTETKVNCQYTCVFCWANIFKSDKHFRPIKIVTYPRKGVAVPGMIRTTINTFMNNYKDGLVSYKLFFDPYDEPKKDWEKLHLRCENQNEKKQNDGSIVLEIIFNHSENHIYIPTVLFTGIFIFLHQGMREKILSLIFNVCELLGYRLFIVDMVESFHENLVQRGATCIDYETVEITKFTNLEIQ